MTDAVARLKKVHPFVYGVVGCGLLLAGFLGYAHFRIMELQSSVVALTAELNETNEILAAETGKLASNIGALDQELDAKAAGLEGTLTAAQQELQSTKSELANTKSQVAGTAAAVGTLEKLSKTDPELLQKYSKVYFLSEHYAPQRVSAIDKKYLYRENRPESIESRVWPHLKRLLDDAEAAGVTVYVASAYRSFSEQQALKGVYTTTFGSNANTFSADQGYSEHQLGTAVDFITTGLGGELEGFEDTQTYAWLLVNAYKYGFILSYPQNNQYYVFEPWHWRFVGTHLATDLRNQGKGFYDLDQRELDPYLVNIFD